MDWMLIMSFIFFFLILPLILIYVFFTGLTTTWLHNYLTSTSKVATTDYTHDHRMCVIVSFFWPLVLLYLSVIYIGKFVHFVYSYPGIIYTEIRQRRKIFEKK